MLASYEWLKALSGVDITAEQMAEKLTSAGLEVESLTRKGEGFDHVVVAEVRGIRPHPAREKLRLVTVFDGEREQEVVCGAANVPAPGGRVILAKLGAVLPGNFVIAERELGGIVSCGMLCSEGELQIGPGGDGIFIFSDCEPAAPGTPVADALGLRDVIIEIAPTAWGTSVSRAKWPCSPACRSRPRWLRCRSAWPAWRTSAGMPPQRASSWPSPSRPRRG